MTKLVHLVVVMLLSLVLIPQANAGFTNAPTFDLQTSSNLAGATDAVYILRAENVDLSQDAAGLSFTIPAGYSIDQKFITNKAGVKAISAYGSCPEWTGQAGVTTTTTPRSFLISYGGMTFGGIIITEPTATTQGKMEMTFTGTYSLMNRGCHGELTTVKGFFINPSTPGEYTWAPSTANPKSGSPVTMEPRPGFSQTVTIVGTGETTSVTTTEERPTVTIQTEIKTSAQPVTTIPVQITFAQTTVQRTSSETEVETTVQPPAGGQLPMELIVAAVALVLIAAGAFFILKRRRT